MQGCPYVGARLIVFILVCFAWTAHLVAETDAGEPTPVTLTSQERDWVARHPVMRVGVLTNWAPFSYLGSDGKLVGIDVDLMEVLSKRTGLQFKPVPYENWEQLATNWDDLDMVCSIAQSPLRETVAAFTKDYSSSPLVIVEREGEEVFGTVGVVRDKKLALPRRFFVTQIITNRLPSVRLVLTDSQDESFRLVADKKADATIVNLFVASQYLNSHPHLKLGISGVLVKPQLSLRMAVHRNSEHATAVAILNKGLGSISQHELDEIFARHLLFGLESRQRYGLLRKHTEQFLIGAAVAGALLLLWNYSLQREIRARRKAEAQLREANESMRVFSHSLSHDLRAPLRGMTGFARALKEDYHDKLDAEGQEYVDRIISSGGHMDKMIADVLAYSRATSSEWPMDTVQLDPLVRQLIEEFPPGQRHFFKIDSDLPAVQGHPTLLAQCLGNLLTNAIRYGPKDRTPEVIIRATKDDSHFTVFVEDNGIGIDPKDQQRIFQIFERAAPSGYKGTGIGLAVAAKAAERMGGTIGVESEVGKGSRFWIRLPAAMGEKASRTAGRSEPFWHHLSRLVGMRKA